jgi:putative ribosome biogenesis GTPase RsgA
MHKGNGSVNGRVLMGSNNIYTVETRDRIVTCRIKGKVTERRGGLLQSSRAVRSGGHRLLPDGVNGRIVSREDRTNRFCRWNKKRQAPQTVAANVDGVACVTSAQNPPFRPRFIDRVLAACEWEGIEAAILLNKCDLTTEPSTEERIADYRSVGYRVFRCSALTGEGMDGLSEWLRGKTVVLVGQSGVGKSSFSTRSIREGQEDRDPVKEIRPWNPYHLFSELIVARGMGHRYAGDGNSTSSPFHPTSFPRAFGESGRQEANAGCGPARTRASLAAG